VSVAAVLRHARLAVCLLAVLTPAALDVTLHAQPPAAEEFDELDDFFGFEDEVEPTLLEHARDQAVDILSFLGFAALAMVSFWRRSVRLKYLTLVVCVAYMGVYKSQLISVVNIFGLLTLNLPIFEFSLAWSACAGFTVATTVRGGRLYCGRICACGALTQLVDAVVPKRFQLEVPKVLERRAGYVKFAVLFAAVGYYLATRDIGFYRYIEPFWMYAGIQTPEIAGPTLWIPLVVLLIASVFVRNLYCRFLCPLGAFLGLVSAPTTIFRIKRWKECGTCRICEKTCEWGAIRGPQIVRSECVRCDDCERMFANEAKCPHHRIIAYKAKLVTKREIEASGARPVPALD
jgi:polyferredoxin